MSYYGSTVKPSRPSNILLPFHCITAMKVFFTHKQLFLFQGFVGIKTCKSGAARGWNSHISLLSKTNSLNSFAFPCYLGEVFTLDIVTTGIPDVQASVLGIICKP